MTPTRMYKDDRSHYGTRIWPTGDRILGVGSRQFN